MSFAIPIPVVVDYDELYFPLTFPSMFKMEQRKAKTGDLVLITEHIHEPHIGSIQGVVFADKSGRISFYGGGGGKYVVLVPLDAELTTVRRNGKFYDVLSLNMHNRYEADYLDFGDRHYWFGFVEKRDPII